MFASPTSKKTDKYENFEDWLRRNGAKFSELELRSYDDGDNKLGNDRSFERRHSAEEKKETHYTCDSFCSNNIEEVQGTKDISEYSEMRGIHAKRNIPSNTICVAIPKKCLITVEMGQATEIGQIILRSDLDLDAPKHIFLMIFLLWDRKINGDNSFFKPYYDILPKTLSNIPIFWNDEELQYLKGSYLLTQIKDRVDAITEDYYTICQVAPQLKDIATLEEFQWARMCVCSRNFGLQIDGHRTSALVPHADMLNHHRPRETKWSFDDELQAFTITTLQPIAAGAQVYDSYGQKCNHRFLLNYGFAVEDNHEVDGFCPNEVPFELFIPDNDPLYDIRNEFWMRGENDMNNSNGGFGHSTHALTAALAAATATSGHPSHVARALEAVVDANARSGGSTGSEESGPLARRVRVCVSNNENTRILFSMLRVLVANEEELHMLATAPTLPFGDSGCSMYLSRALRGYTASNPDNSNFLTMQHAAFFRTCRDIRNPIKFRNERAAMQRLLELAGEMLNEYPTSLDKDIADLRDEQKNPKFSNRRHAKIQVRGEKEILHHFAFWAQTACEVINIIEAEIEYERNRLMDPSLEPPQPGFDYIMNAMDDDDALHFTILRYCCDVLGALRKHAIQRIRQERGDGFSL